VIVLREEPSATNEIIKSGIASLWVVVDVQIRYANRMISLPEGIDDVVCFA